LATVALSLSLAGCGNNLAPVSGVVTLDGQPVRGGNGVRGTVYFQPVSGEGRAAVGIVDENGAYRMSSGSEDGVVPGQYLVSFNATQIIESSQPGGTPTGKRITPPAYASAQTSGLQLTVEPGGTQYDLSLSSEAKREP
jgi:hypothetical protein